MCRLFEQFDFHTLNVTRRRVILGASPHAGRLRRREQGTNLRQRSRCHLGNDIIPAR